MREAEGVKGILAAAFIAAASSGQGQAAPVEGAAAWKLIVGNTVVATTPGGSYTDYFAPDGGIRHVDADGKTTGRWSLDGDTVCLDYPDDDDRVCLAPKLDGAQGSFRDPDGAEDRFTVLPGNAKGL